MYKILVIAEGMIPSTELIVLKPFNHMREKGLLNYTLVFIKDILNKLDTFPFENFDCFFVLRICSEETNALFFNKLKSYNKKVIYAIDDDFSNIDSTSSIGGIYIRMNPKKGIEIACRNSDLVLTFSKFLCDKLSIYNSHIIQMPELVDFDFINSIKVVPRNKTKVVIGYAATQHTHMKDFEIVAPALKRILEENKDTIEFECFFDNKPEEFRNNLNFKCLGSITGLDNYYTFIANRKWDIGIAPLEDTNFNNAKSDVKYREYAALSIPGIYSDIEMHREIVKPNITGLLCNNTEYSWYNGLKLLINYGSLRKIISDNSYDHANSYCSMEKITDLYSNIFKIMLDINDDSINKIFFIKKIFGMQN